MRCGDEKREEPKEQTKSDILMFELEKMLERHHDWKNLRENEYGFGKERAFRNALDDFQTALEEYINERITSATD